MKVDAHFCGASLQKVAQAERGSMQLLAEFGEHVIAGAIAVEGYAVSEGSGGELELSRSRATLVRDYIHCAVPTRQPEHRNSATARSSSAVDAKE